MVTKFLSLGTVGFCVFTYIISQLDPNNILVYTFLANNLVNSLIKFIAVAGMLLVLLKGGFKGFWAQIGLRVTAVGLLLFSGSALVSPRLWNASYAYLKPLDLILLMEVSIVLCLVSLQAPPIKRPKWQLHRLLSTAWEARPRGVMAAGPRLVSAALNALREEQPTIAH